MAINFCFDQLDEQQRLAVGNALLLLSNYYYTEGHMSRYPLYHEKPLFVGEYETYMMLGLARFLWGKNEEGAHIE